MTSLRGSGQPASSAMRNSEACLAGACRYCATSLDSNSGYTLVNLLSLTDQRNDFNLATTVKSNATGQRELAE